MALGGGKWVTQNKILPGAYENVISLPRATATLSDRGIATIPVELNWGPDGEVFEVKSGDFFTKSEDIFGYGFTDDEMVRIREIFKHAKTVYFYRLNSGEKAENDFAEAKYSGTRGNDLKIIISADVDDEDLYVVETVLGTRQVDVQYVKSPEDLKDNNFVTWKKDIELTETASTPLTGGTNKSEVTGEDYQDYLDKISSYTFNTMGCPTSDEKIIDLFVQYTKRMRDEVGAFFQTVVYAPEGTANTEAVIELLNKVVSEKLNKEDLVYWTTGAEAGCELGRSLTNFTYDGELDIDVDLDQGELENAILDGKLVFHRQDDDIRILSDINSLTEFTIEKSRDFSKNTVIRTIDSRGISIATVFNDKYNGKVPNDADGRDSLWEDIVSINKLLEDLRAIQDYDPADLILAQGNEKDAVIASDMIKPTDVMEKLYMNTYLKE